MKVKLLRDRIIIPTLYEIDLYSAGAVNLLLGTAAQESHLCEIRQWGFSLDSKEGAFGIYQMELTTYESLWKDYINYRPDLKAKMETFKDNYCSPQMDLMSNPFYATAMARIKYKIIKEALPASDDLYGLAKYWKRYYNSLEGKGCIHEFIRNYKKYIEEES
jgi:hypothetical protein